MKPDVQGWYWYRSVPYGPWDMVYVFREQVVRDIPGTVDVWWQLSFCQLDKLESIDGEWSQKLDPPKE